MRYTIWLLLMLAAALTVAVGCSDDSTSPVETQSTTGLLEGEIGTADFEISVNATGNSRRRFEGPFVLRGSNLHYVDSLQALSVDLTITNRGQVSHAEPVGLTFVHLFPDTVTVENPDNGINGEGAAIDFAFANDDGIWTPGESSLPRNVLFGVGPGQAIGFVARLDIGETIDGGSITGRVWNDANRDGVMDADEVGIAGVSVYLRSIDEEPDTTVTDSSSVTRTDRNGLFGFHQLRAGVYVVGPGANPRLMPTTPTEITVLLTETENDVSDFTDANFGAVPNFDPPDPYPIGAYAEVNGVYVPDPDRINAKGIELERCNSPAALDGGGDGDDDDGDDDGDNDDNDGAACWRGILRGPVTAVDDTGFAVMGTLVTWSSMPTPTPHTEVEIGDRVDVRVYRNTAGDLVVYRIREWNGQHEQVHGRIQDVEFGEGEIRLRVLDTLVIVTRNNDDVVTP